jgi:hypothetical protein
MHNLDQTFVLSFAFSFSSLFAMFHYNKLWQVVCQQTNKTRELILQDMCCVGVFLENLFQGMPPTQHISDVLEIGAE